MRPPAASVVHAWSAPLLCLLMGLGCLPAVALAEPGSGPAPPQHVFIGTYSGAKSQGIYRALFNPASGELSGPELAAEATNPSFLAIHPNQKFLYAVSREGDPQGGVLAFAIDPASGKLTKLGEQAACGDAPCHLSVDRSGKCVLVASYSSGTVAALPIRADGSLANATAVIQHVDPDTPPVGEKPRTPRAHSIHADPQNRFAVAADLGLDELLVYRLDAEHARLTPNDPPFTAVKRGSGPRHFAFHPNGKFAFSNMETSSAVKAFAYDAEHGTLAELQTLPTLPADYPGPNSTAEIQVRPDGKSLYVSNRGNDSIAMFSVDPANGQMAALGHQASGGRVPRNFSIDPTGQYLLAANQDSNTIVVFRIAADGRLEPTDRSIEVGTPVCLKWVAVP